MRSRPINDVLFLLQIHKRKKRCKDSSVAFVLEISVSKRFLSGRPITKKVDELIAKAEPDRHL